MRAPPHLAEAFAFQSKACASLGSPFMGRLMALCATADWPDSPITTRIFGWPGDLGPRAQSVPLRLAGALHALHLQGHAGLGPVYPPHDVSDADLWRAVRAALVADAAAIDAFVDSPPQTNEVRRAVTLIATAHWLNAIFGKDFHCCELGASGGLNLHWDSYALQIGDQTFGAPHPALTLTPTWTGPLPPDTRPTVASRAGVDINPLSPAHDALRLQAYLWPDQPERLDLTRAAIAAAATPVEKADAIDWLAPRLRDRPANALMFIYSTIAWQYFPSEKQALGTRLIEEAGAGATQDAPLAWFGMENDGGVRGAALTLRLWPGDHRLSLGRADFHGRWVDWSPPAFPL